jgi:hypothetical protein
MRKPLLSPGSSYAGIVTPFNQKFIMKKSKLLTLLFALLTLAGFSQSGKYWTINTDSRSNIPKDKSVSRLSFPATFALFNLDIEPLRQELFTIVDNRASRHSTIISLPNTEGEIEDFEIVEASNFEPALQARFPEIRAFSGKGITDRSASLKLSLSPQGIQTMIFRTEKENEFIEAYSRDHSVYAVFRSYRRPGQLPWTCSTAEQHLADGINTQVALSGITARSGGDLKTMRLAQSCNAEYSNYFGATSASQVALVLAAFNATLTRCNGVYEKDLALHLNLISNTTSVIYYNPSTDPYSTTLSQWNAQLQSTLTSVIGEANYDIGHMFGASGGGGNAGCIGCVCTNGSKGSGITSPADGIPQGDNFDIDYVVHEVGHQLGANHTFSHSLEGSGVNKEVGSGITIMGYAGITNQDVANHSIDIYHQASIAQIQANLANKTCPVTTSITANNATPVVAAVSNYTIPKSTPFALTGSATDANPGDVLTYCWEQNDNATTSGSNSVASATKTTGPNWISFSPTTSPTRYFPKLSTILAGALISGPLTGGDAGANTEALSSVARTLNFRLTVRDNAPYSSTAPVSVGQTSFTDMTVTVNSASGPFAVTAPNTAVSWAGNSTQAITWSVASTTAAPVSCANVKITLSTDGGQTFPTVLAESTPNDGTESLTIPNTPTTTARIKVEAVGNIFFDISNTNFTITAASAGLTTISTSAVSPTTYCAGAAVNVPFTINAAANAGNVFTAQLSNASGSFSSPVSIGTLTSTSAGTISATIPAGTAAGIGYRVRVVSSSPAVTGSDNGANITVNVGPAASTISAGGATTFCAGGSVVLSGNVGGTWITGATTSSITVNSSGTYFVTNSNSCGSVQSNSITVTVNPQPTASTISAGGATTFCAGGSVVLSGNVGGTWSTGATTSSITVNSSGTYFVTNSNSCGSVQSNSITVTVNPQPTASTISAGGATTFCAGGSVVLSGNAGGTWSTGATTSSITVNSSGTYFVTNSNSCGSVQSNSITVTVNPQPTASTISAGGATTFCAGGSVVLNGNVGGTWSTGATTLSITVNSSGTYFVTNSNSCGSVQSNSITVNVTANAVVSVSIIAEPGNVVCAGTSVKFTATPVNGGGSPSYNWSVNGTSVASGAGLNTYTSSALTNGSSVSCVLTSNIGGCATNNPATSNTINMTVNPLPVVSFSGLSTSYTVTAGNVTLTGSPAGGTFSGPGISGNTFSPSSAGIGGPYTITYTYTNANGCTNISSQQTTITGTCTVPKKPGTITTVGGTAKVCPGDSKTYSIVAVTGATSYTWTAPPGGVVTGGQGTLSATITYNAGFTVGDSLRVTANNTCGSSEPRGLKINRNAVPSTPSVIAGSVYGVCNNNGVPYSVTAVAGNTYTWSWDNANATVASGQGSNAITANFAGLFVSGKLSVIATNACGSSAARSLTVYAKPATPSSISGAVSVCSGQAGVPYSITPLSNVNSYVWYAPTGGRISDGITTSTSTSLTTTSPSVTVNFGSTAGLVRVKGVNVCASGAVASLTVAFTCKEPVSDLSEISLQTTTALFPNPSNGDFTIQFEKGSVVTGMANVEVVNEFGQTVYRASQLMSNGMMRLTLHDKLTNGVYLLKCSAGGQTAIKKIIISK